ncbi:hypothetical protein J7E90_22965 [Streptomyces sp. ISL-111]|uniref:DUF5336 domain-containing protein n=1 Tax=unclassified Streptomyces TaxID=2593676 RepID=UPI001BEA2437|nr:MULTISPECIES: DUF5336 domain-containing protein [unclassified Streptomyces]MBT2380115.1 hypothetical protein [Streptomyces sp. ISL-111]MBT2429829.1 hypothetical protein [Streptomyces sp. ISL-112]MBT2463458.1 hypothetical protein [Streptomyces sp. ISL-63]
MNIRSLTRGDGVVIGAAVVLFIASFLDLSGYDCPSGVDCSRFSSPNAWDSLGLLMSVFLAGIIGAALVVVGRLTPGRKVVGFDLGQFGAAFTVFALWTAFWTTIDVSDAGAGLILGLLATIVLAAGAIAGPLVPALKAPIVGAPKPPQAVQPPYGGQPGQGYGYPGAQQQPYGAQPSQGYGYPGAQAGGQPGQPGQADPAAAQAQAAQAQQSAPQGGAAPAGDFTPFWFAVPVARPLYGEDGAPNPIAELAPGTWYLAVEQRGQGLIAQTQDGRRGVLQDTTGIQRG